MGKLADDGQNTRERSNELTEFSEARSDNGRGGAEPEYNPGYILPDPDRARPGSGPTRIRPDPDQARPKIFNDAGRSDAIGQGR